MMKNELDKDLDHLCAITEIETFYGTGSTGIRKEQCSEKTAPLFEELEILTPFDSYERIAY